MDKGAVTGVVKGMVKKFMRKLAIWAVVLVVGVTVGKLYRTTVEQSLGMLDRVKLLWPDDHGLDAKDRDLIAALAVSCQIEKQPVEVEAIKGCLRLGARSTLSKLPKGVTLGEAQTRLEVLLKQAYNQGR